MTTTRSVHRQKAVALVSAIALANMTLSACQTTSMQRFDDPGDQCVSYRQPLIESQNALGEPIVAGAVIGAVGVGLLAGLLTGDVGAGLAGAAAGGLAGAAGGYYASKQREAANQREMLAAIDRDAGNDAQRFGRIGTAIRGLENCRVQQITDIRSQVLSGRMSREQGRMARNQVVAALREDGDLMNEILGHADQRVETYVQSRTRALGEETAADTQAIGQQDRPRRPTSNKLSQKNSSSKAQQIARATGGSSEAARSTTQRPTQAAAKTAPQAAATGAARIHDSKQSFDHRTQDALSNLDAVL